MKIFVGCGSRSGKSPRYTAVAREFGEFIAKYGHDLVYGGCARGVMGTLQSTVAKEPKSDIYIVTCNAYYEDIKELPYREAYSYPTVNERKNKFIELSDLLVYLPGGVGTDDEFSSALEAKKNGEHNLPMIVFNIEGSFEPRQAVLERAVEDNFVDSNIFDLFHVVSDMDEFKKVFFALDF